MKLYEPQTAAQIINRDTAGPAGETPLRIADPTVGEHLDAQIDQARRKVESLCIIKAKAEASGILNFPHSFIREVSNAYGPF